MKPRNGIYMALSIAFAIISIAACVFSCVTLITSIKAEGVEALSIILLLPVSLMSIGVQLIAGVVSLVFSSLNVSCESVATKIISIMLIVVVSLALLLSIGLLTYFIVQSNSPAPTEGA